MSSAQHHAGSNSAYVGFWVDYDRGGRVQGATLTLRNRDSALLLAFLAVLVGLSANRSWKTWRLAIVAQSRGLQSPSMRRKELQIIFRNSETTGAALWSLITLPLKSQGPVNGRDSLKTAVAALLALIHMLAFLAAGILTSQVILGRDVTSKVTPTCGQWLSKYNVSDQGLSSSPEAFAGIELITNETIDADNYVHNCYPQAVSRDVLQCGTLMSRYLTFEEKHNVECPFVSDICRNGTNLAFEMDTGNISLSDLGVNSQYSKSLFFRKRSICAPIKARPFMTGIFNTSNIPSLDPGEVIFEFTFTNQTKVFNISKSYRFDNYSAGYQLDSTEIRSSIFTRSTALLTRNGASDLSLVILNGMGITYLLPYDDLWFSVHQELTTIPGSLSSKLGLNYYGMDNAVNILACDEQLMLCSSFSNNCTAWRPLASLEKLDVMALVRPGVTFESKEYNETSTAYQVVLQNTDASHIATAIGNRGAAALQTARYVLNHVQTRLAAEQWKVELRYWFSVTLARIQLSIFNTIEKPPGLDEAMAENFWVTKVPGMLEYCGRVKFRSPDHTSLSAVGICLTVALTAFLMLGSYTELLIGRFNFGKPFITKWDEMESLALFHEVKRMQLQ